MTPPNSTEKAFAQDFKSVITLDKSQRRFFDDTARVIGVNFHRQKGKDFAAACKAINEGLQRTEDWTIVGLNQNQADETFRKCKRIVDSMKGLLKRKFGTDRVEEDHSEEYDDYLKDVDHHFVCRARKLILPNGSRIISRAGRNPNSVVGSTGNLLFTEFGLLPGGGYEHWGLLFPITTSAGFKFIMISTPRGKNTKFYEIMSNAEGLYSTHFCDIYKSVYEDGYQLYDAMGKPFPQNTREEQELAIKTFRRIYADEGKWAREYECNFTGDLSALVPWAELERAAQLGEGKPFDWVDVTLSGQPLGDVWMEMKNEVRAGGRVEVGWDVARTTHISAVTINFARQNQPKHLRFLVAMHDLPFEDQRAFVRAAMDLKYGSVGAGDATGLGRESNEAMARLYRDRWDPFQFTLKGKREIASSLRTAFSDGNQTLPSHKTHKFVSTDIYAIQKDDSGGQLLLEETPNPLMTNSHCDIGWSLGLNRVAGSKTPPRFVPPPLKNIPVGLGL
jgi:phage FluMu gp28-like protein